MVKIEYVYQKPKKSYKKLEAVLVMIVLLVAALWIFAYFNFLEDAGISANEYNGTESGPWENIPSMPNMTPSNADYENVIIPPEYTGPEGLEYVRTNYAPNMDEAKSLCTEQFKGEWRDTATEMGCYNMRGFLTLYCTAETIQKLTNLCDQINGDSTCSSDTVSCTVQ